MEIKTNIRMHTEYAIIPKPQLDHTGKNRN